MIERRLDRRQALQTFATALASAPVAHLLGCGGANLASTSPAEAGAGADGAAANGWATGGTASMSAKASYPNPFASGSTSGCVATGTLTEGPCYDSASELVQDISYGQAGLPVRMYFQVLDATCTPISGATVDVWHVAPTGKYSGDDTAHENVAFCTGNDAEYASHLYFRGKQKTDVRGVVYFDTCFPGWYSGRTVHVHFTITVGSKTFTSQYVFEDALDDEIIATQPVYDARGKRDTTNLTDTVVSPADYQQFLFQTARMNDGAMLAWKAIVLGA